ncbi:DNA-binding response regulator [Thalassobaculum fulvum]|uniref:DNA-binding response regulator n=1 Tax=Thalassobaculum fulvum TaxID=1633335 RepID=A0A919CNT2_9PROT|nr:DNA-binding response regulator [Thalassobaculum fulvum]
MPETERDSRVIAEANGTGADLPKDGPCAYVVDDIELNREMLVGLLTTEGLQARSYASARQFLEGFVPDRPGCILLDFRMPGMNGLELQAELNQRGVVLPVVMITAHADVPIAIQAMREGAYEFIEKPVDNQHLLGVVRRAFEVSAERLQERAERDSVRARYDTLSARELQVLDAMIAGRLNKQIAFDLGISQRTVEVHRANVMEKMQARSLAELVRMTIRLGEVVGGGGGGEDRPA